MIKVEVHNWESLASAIWGLVLDRAVNDGIKKTIIKLDWEAKEEQRSQRVWDTWLLANSYKTKFSNLLWELYNFRKYWIYQHEGTKHLKARPWFTDALEANKYLPEQVINKEILNTLKKLWVKL